MKKTLEKTTKVLGSFFDMVGNITIKLLVVVIKIISQLFKLIGKTLATIFVVFKKLASPLSTRLATSHFGKTTKKIWEKTGEPLFSPIKKLLSQKKYRKYRLPTLVVLVLLLSAVTYLGLRDARQTEAAWFNEGWLYRKRIPITNAGSAQTDFQVLVKIDTATLISAGKLQSNCNDIRFTNKRGNILSHHQTTACDASATRFWVKIDNIPTSSSNIFVYYGNSSAPSTSSKETTFNLSYLGTFSQLFADTNIATNHGASSDRENNLYISQSGYVNRFNASWVYQQQFSGLDIYTGLCYDDKRDRFYGVDWSSKQWSSFSTSFTETAPMDQSLGGEPIDCGTDSTYIYTNHRNGSIQRNLIADNTSSSINMDTLAGFDWGGQGLTYAFGYLFAGTTAYGANSNRIYVIDIDDWSNPIIVTYWDANGHTLSEVSGLTWKDKYIYQTARSQDFASEWQGPVKTAATEPVVGSFAAEEVTPGPVAYWKFDEGYGTTANDSGAMRNNGTITGATWASEDQCISGKCLYFDGDEDWINITAMTLEKEGGSLCLWYNSVGDYTANYSGRGAFLSGTFSTHSIFTLQDNGSGYRIEAESLFNGNYISATDRIYEKNEWRHVCLVADSNTVNTYVDAQLVDTRTADDDLYFNVLGAGHYNYVDLNRHQIFHGFLDEMIVYPYARSAAQIKADYNAGKAGAASSKGSGAAFGGSSEGGTLSDGLVGYWKMDEASTPSLDSSGNSNSGTWVGNAAAVTGKFGNGVSFDNIGDAVSLGSPTTFDFGNNGSFTFAGWVKPTTLDNYDAFVSKDTAGRNSPYSYMTVFMADGRLYAYNSSAWITVCGAGSIVTGSWQHVVFDYDGTTITGYINGQTCGSAAFTYPDNAAHEVSIGSWYSPSTAYDFHGVMDDIRIYNRALSPGEVSQLYNWAPGPVTYYSFDEGSGTSLNDHSGNGHNSTSFVGSPTWSEGKYGKALYFNGTSDAVTLPSSALPATQKVTICTWAKGQNEPRTNSIFEAADGSGNRVANSHINYSNGNTYWDFGDATYDRISQANDTATYNKWTHWCFLADNEQDVMSIYRNGTLWLTGAHAKGLATAPTTFAIGSNDTADANRYKGWIDEFKIYNYARTPGQIVQDMNAGHPIGGSPISSKLLHYQFDEGANNTCSGGTNDVCNSGSGGNTYDGAISGSPSRISSGKFNKALTFNDVDSVITHTAKTFAATEPWTFTMWQKTSGDSWNGFIGSSLGNDGYWMWHNSGKLTVYFVSPTPVYFSNTVLGNEVPENEWFHLAVVSEPVSSSVVNYHAYINGVLTETKSNITVPNSEFTFQYVGRGGGTRWFDGSLDEVKIYSAALTPEEVRIDMNAGASSNFGTGYDEQSNLELPVRSGLVLELDAKNPISYPGSGNTWNNIAGSTIPNVSTTTAIGTGTVTYNSAGYFTFGAGTTEADYFTWPEGTWPATYDGDSNSIQRSWEAWFRPHSLDYDSIFSLYTGEGCSFSCNGGIWTDDNMKFRWYDNAAYLELPTSSTYSANNWHHVVVTYDDTQNPKIYVDGEYQGGYGSATNMDYSDGVDGGSIGYHPTGSGNGFFDGDIAIIRYYYNKALNGAEVKHNYNVDAGRFNLVTTLDKSTVNGPIAEYKLDEKTGTTAYDTSGNGYDLSFGATPTWTNAARCKVGACLDFDANDYLQDDWADFSLVQQTIEFWMKTDVVGTSWVDLVGTTNNSDSNRFHLQSTDNSIIWYNPLGSGTGNNVDSNIIPVAGQWYHVAGTYDGTTLRVYIDGQQKNTRAASITSYSSTGAYIGGATEDFDGMIDNVKIFDYARTPAQIAYDYNRGKPVGHWKLDECQGTTAYDSSGNGNNGTITIGASGTNTSAGTCAGSAGQAWYDGATGKRNASLEFDGTDDWIDSITMPPIQTSPNIFTIVGWIKPNNHTSRFLTPSSNGIDQWIGYQGSSQWLNVSIAQSSDTNQRQRYSSAGSVPIGEWTHFAVSLNDKELKIFINGELDVEFSETIDIGDWTGTWRIGQRGNSTNWYSGQMDDLQVFGYALTPTQVKTLYNGSAINFGPETGSP